MKVKFTKLHPDAQLPTKGTEGSAGFDLTAINSPSTFNRDVYTIRTGIAIELPKGYMADVRPRSSISKESILIHYGTIDSDYRGEIVIIAQNLTKPVSIKAGDRVAQLVIQKIPSVEFVEVEELGETERGAGGLGSTGK